MAKEMWKIPCVWQMMGYLEVEADTPEEAWKTAEKEEMNCPLPDNGQYLEDSFELDYEGEPLLIKKGMNQGIGENYEKEHPYSIEELEWFVRSVIEHSLDASSVENAKENLLSYGFDDDDLKFFGFPEYIDGTGTIYEQTIFLSRQTLNDYRRLLTIEPKEDSECMGEDKTISHTAVFENGMEADVKLCGVQYKEGESNLPWAEAVLFHNGSEIAHTDASDEIEGD